jgi:hypothetical protein
MSTKLPNPLPQSNILFKKKHRREYIGAKAAKENKKDAYYTQKQARHNTED